MFIFMARIDGAVTRMLDLLVATFGRWLISQPWRSFLLLKSYPKYKIDKDKNITHDRDKKI